MTMFDTLPCAEVWALDFEYIAAAGERPEPVCLVARDLKSGREVRQWREEMGAAPPYSVSESSLIVTYNAIAEVSCHLALGWPPPKRILDLYVEFKNHTNGLVPSGATGLIAALSYFGLPSISAAEKAAMRDLVLRGGPWTDQEKRDVLDYCASDVQALELLLVPMMRYLDLPRALYRGRYMAAAAAVEHNGVPIDTTTLAKLQERWDDIKDLLIADVDKEYGVYEGRIFKQVKFEAYLEDSGIPWPRLPTGKLSLADDTFRQMAKAYPQVSALRELRSSLADLRFSRLTVGRDGRNRYALFPFSSVTGRNQPSSTRAIFGNSVWLRGLIKPNEGYGLAYIDWSQQEFGIAAALSGDRAMLEAYSSGDPYLKFGQQAGAIPADATKDHPKREVFKQCVLAVQYGMGPEGLAARIGQPVMIARDLLRMHRETFATFWKCSDDAETHAMLTRQISTLWGWTEHIGSNANPRQIRNFPMQANGAEMMRLACCLGIERGIEIAAPVHDAFLIVAPLEHLQDEVAAMQACMAEASRIVLDGLELRSDAKLIRYPDRFMDESRGRAMWDRVTRLIEMGNLPITDGYKPNPCVSLPATGVAASVQQVISLTLSFPEQSVIG